MRVRPADAASHTHGERPLGSTRACPVQTYLHQARGALLEGGSEVCVGRDQATSDQVEHAPSERAASKKTERGKQKVSGRESYKEVSCVSREVQQQERGRQCRTH
jgi:hypothetical protein